jgi:SulP family sulfate permease
MASPQDMPAVILSLSAASVAQRMGTGDPQALFATVAMLIAVSAFLCGLALWLVGRFRLGRYARFLPYPVMGGFLASIGYLLAWGGVELAAGDFASPAELFAPHILWRWAPAFALGAVLLAASRLLDNGLVVPLVTLAAFAGFYLLLHLSGVDLAEAGAAGLLMGGVADGAGSLFGAVGPATPLRADWGQILVEAPAIVTLVGFCVVEALLTASAIELATGDAVDLDRDARGLGLANMVASLGGGIPGYHVLGETMLGARMLGGSSRIVGVVTGLIAAGALFGGAPLLAALPVGVFAGLLIYLGLELLYDWLWLERARLPAADFAIVALILGVAIAFGFFPAVASGLAAASVLFVIACARIGPVRSRATGALRPSTVERPPADIARLAGPGQGVLIYELQGFLFFATASALHERISPEIEHPRGAPPRAVLLDFRRVQGFDVSAAFNLDRLAQLAARCGVALGLCHLAPGALARLERMGLAHGCAVFATLDDALARFEDEALAEAPEAAAAPEAALGPLIARICGPLGSDFARRLAVPAGTVVIEQGAPSDSLMLLESGRLCARVIGPDGSALRVATFLPGALAGEIGVYAGAPRSATVAAEIDSVVLAVSHEALDRLARTDPRAAAEFHGLVAALLARRLTRTTALLRAVGS